MRPNARPEGFAWFNRLSARVHRVTLIIDYRRSGETKPRVIEAPFTPGKRGRE